MPRVLLNCYQEGVDKDVWLIIILIIPILQYYIDGLAHDSGNCIVNALELPQPYANLWIYTDYVLIENSIKPGTTPQWCP